MNICIVGAGYVGLTTAAVLSQLGHSVVCVDRDKGKISLLNSGIIPIFEPGLNELIENNRNENRLLFSSEVEEHLEKNEVIMIAVGTPSASDGTADLVYVKSVLLTISEVIRTYKTIILKSTVPPGTGNWAVRFLLDKGLSSDVFDIVSNPEFLREGTAIFDSLHPDRMVIGATNEIAIERVRELYAGIQTETLITGRTEAEMIKYGSNAFLATKLSFINELARICDVYDADITKVSVGIGMDSRIGGKFFQAGIGYGGSCLPKDVNALIGAAATKALPLNLLHTVAEINDSQLDVYVEKLERVIGSLNENSHIAVWGATFKENTDDIRYSQAIAFMERLAARGCQITAYDPLVAPQIVGVSWSDTAMRAVQDVDALIVATGWQEFLQGDWKEVKGVMRGNVVMDGRNVLDRIAIEQEGLRYVGVGRP
ncbi:UDP-glucose/GDP-mannose dehydrogenase family protein [Paenibacillus sp. GSMTC-2017]|uniref:UDP-glucose dehydrogenase family protein n=1 Tax=Paenibacillus sp. GSMTC-2017 TaxID=2794350 RepID=UPI0018D87523|nr:UDP-glucose/GDP-mannose dehydrogenase family protein [Paenibacillus sp. GSMTC-2017]MBH5318275.1 UDP-glucose/GDP-mannose dehydrogenase family protein [Paenibacillus sp. GSMTC-2017]